MKINAEWHVEHAGNCLCRAVGGKISKEIKKRNKGMMPLYKIMTMSKQLINDGLGWGVLLWMIGYVLGVLLFMIVPVSFIGWIISPIGVVLTLWVLTRKIRSTAFQYYAGLAVIWTIIAIAFDYLFLVRLIKPEDGYYKLDVYIYYLLTFVLPLLVGYRKAKSL